MRPRELTVRGFRSYADETLFEWDGRSLVGIVGPIGSGKTSILDAVSFALYGKTPRVERDTKSLINQRRDAMHVALTFEVDDSVWKAVRTLRRGGASSHTLYRLEEGAETVVSDRARDVGERVETLLGLDFDAFRRSVLLAQNQFAGFLEATGTDRNQVLKGVFGFNRLDAMRAATKDRLDVLTGRLAVLADRRQTAETDRIELKEAREGLEAAETRAAALEELRVPFEEIKEVIGESAARATGAEDLVARLTEIADRVPDPEQAEEHLAAAERAATSVAEAAAEHGAATQLRSEAVAALDESLASVGGRSGLTEAGDLVGAWKAARHQSEGSALGEKENRSALGATGHVLTEAEAAQVQAATVAAAAAEAQERAVEARHLAQEALQRARQEHRAHALRGDLVVGEECPVCLRPVESLPEADGPVLADEAERVAAEAERELERLSKSAQEAAAEAVKAEAATAAAEQARATAVQAAADSAEAAEADRAALAEAAKAASSLLGKGDPEESLDAVRAAVAAAEVGVAEATAQEAAGRAALDQAQALAEAAKEALGLLRTELATVAGTLEVEVRLDETPQSVRAGLAELRESWVARMDQAEQERRRATEEAAAAIAARGELMQGAGLAESDDIVDVLSAARAEVTGRAGVVEVLEKRLADLDSLDADEGALLASSETLTRLHSDLAPSRFLEFVLDERRRALGDLASEHLEVLTAGRYRFDESGDFLVVDLTAADAVRAAASLSGGETFLASLALALALAEVVSREGGRLDAFFLDEGFGSLDPEHLDLAMDGIERLVTTGPERLVVVVSHVAAMQDRIEDLVRLDRDPITGDTRVLMGAS